MLRFEWGNSAENKLFEVFFCCAESEEESALERDNNMKDALKHGSFGPVCGPRMAKCFRISWMHARSSWTPLSLLYQKSHGHLQILLDSRHKFWMACIWRAVHSSTQIWLGSSRRVLPENRMTNAGKILQVTLEEEFPGLSNYTIFHPWSKLFLMKLRWICLQLCDKWKPENYNGTSSNELQMVLRLTKTWFGCGTMQCFSFEQVEEVFRTANVAHCQRGDIALHSGFAHNFKAGPWYSLSKS